MIKAIETDKAPPAIGPYSQATVANGFIFCSGQLGIDPETEGLESGIEAQTHQALKNLREVLKAADSNLDYVVKATIFITNMYYFPKINKIYEQYFPEHKPARATVEVSNLPKGALIEIDAVAISASTI